MDENKRDRFESIDRFRSRKAYRSVHADEAHVAADVTKSDWKVYVGGGVILLVVLAAFILAVRSLEPNDPRLDLVRLQLTSDESDLYLLITTRGELPPDFSRHGYVVAIDTYDAARGARRLPAPYDRDVPSGIEFVIEIAGPGRSFIRTLRGYDPHRGEEPIYSQRDAPPEFDHLSLAVNRERFGRDGVRHPAVNVDRGALRFGSLDPEAADFDTRSDVAAGPGVIEMRIPWALLNVTDPSSRTVLHSLEGGRDSIGTTRTEGFRIYVYAFDAVTGEVVDALPSGSAGSWVWSEWDAPTWRLEPKAGISTLKSALARVPDSPADAAVAADVP